MAVAIQTLEDERMVSYVPLLVLSEEVIFLPSSPTLPPKGKGVPSPMEEGRGEGTLLKGG